MFCLLFMAYWGLMVYLIQFALDNGDIDRLLKPRDMDQSTCGLVNEQNGNTKDLTEYNQVSAFLLFGGRPRAL